MLVMVVGWVTVHQNTSMRIPFLFKVFGEPPSIQVEHLPSSQVLYPRPLVPYVAHKAFVSSRRRRVSPASSLVIMKLHSIYSDAAASTAPTVLNLVGFVITISTGYFHSMNCFHPSSLSACCSDSAQILMTHPNKQTSSQSICPDRAQ
jgi:hypothetical protein